MTTSSTLPIETVLAGEATRAFARDVLQVAFDGHDLDGGEIQTLGVKYGLLRETRYDPAKHGETSFNVDDGDIWFEVTDALAAAPPASPLVEDLEDAISRLGETLRRLRDATPQNTNSGTVKDAFSWFNTVTHTALGDLDGLRRDAARITSCLAASAGPEAPARQEEAVAVQAIDTDDLPYCAGAIGHIDIGGLTERHVRELRTHAEKLRWQGIDVAPEHGWTCFHCAQTFTTWASASAHFGDDPSFGTRPVCVPAPSHQAGESVQAGERERLRAIDGQLALAARLLVKQSLTPEERCFDALAVVNSARAALSEPKP